MSKYQQRQIAHGFDLALLHKVDLTFSDEQCEQYLDWHLRTQTAEAKGTTSMAEARSYGLSNGAQAFAQIKTMLKYIGS